MMLQCQRLSSQKKLIPCTVWLTGCEDESSKDPDHLAAATCLMMDHCGQRLASMTPHRARELVSWFSVVHMYLPPSLFESPHQRKTIVHVEGLRTSCAKPVWEGLRTCLITD